MKALKKRLSFILALVMIVSAFAVMPLTVNAESITATENWGAAEDGKFYVTCPADFVALGANAQANSWYAGKTVEITADLDMEGHNWAQATSFRGNINGNGHVIKNLNINSAGLFGNLGGEGIVIRDLAITDTTVTAAHPAVFARDVLGGTTVDVTFENVYVNATINCSAGTQYAGGFFGRHAGAGKLNFKNCVSECKISGSGTAAFGGFIGQTNAHAFTLSLTDCASFCDLSEATATIAVTGFVGYARANIIMERCVSMCRENANQANFAAIMQINPSGGGPYTLSIEDCYAAVGTKQAYTVASGATFHNLSVVNDGKTVLSVAAGTDISTKKAELNATANYIASGDTVNIEAQALADKLGSCWVATDKTVAYGSGKTVNAVMPQPIVHLLDKTFEDIVGAEYLQFGTTESGYDVRFVGTVDIEDLSKYSAVGFDIEVRVRGGNVIKSGTLTTDKVFTSIKAAGVDCSAESLNTNYLNVLQITGFKNENIYDIKLTAFAVDAGGDVIYDYSGVVEISVQNGAIIK